MAEANEDTISGIGPLFPELGVAFDAHLLAYYGPPADPLQDQLPSTVTLALLRECLEDAPLLSTPHKDGWRNEYFTTEMARDPACGEAIANLMTIVVAGDVPTKRADTMSFATVIALLKKDAATIEARTQAPTRGVPTSSPNAICSIGMGRSIVKLACNYALFLDNDAMGPMVGPS